MTTKYSPPENHYITLDIVFATEYGTNQALLFAKLYRLQTELSGYTDDNGDKWVRFTYEEWEKELPFIKRNTIIRTIEDAEKKGLIFSTVFEKRSKWYRCNPDFIDDAIHKVSTQDGYKEPQKDKYLPKMSTQNEQLPKLLPNKDIIITTTHAGEISQYFSERTKKQPRGLIDQQEWDADSQDILDKAKGDVTRAKGLVDQAINTLEGLNYTYKSPASLLSTIDNMLKPKPARNGASENGHKPNPQPTAESQELGEKILSKLRSKNS